MADAKTADPRVVTIKNVRLSFCNGLRNKTKSHPDAKEKHSCSFILDPGVSQHEANVKAVKKAIAAAEVKEFGEGKAGIIAKTVQDNKRIVFRDAETFTNEDGEVYDGYNVEGAYGLGSCKSDKRPKLFNRAKEAVELDDIDDVFQAGQYCDAIVSFYCTSKKEQGGRGLFASVQLIRAYERGETFGAGNSASADDLDDLEDDDGMDADDDMMD